jgi:glutamine---fructose-6-phosphate transaminase (isomerizing)
VTSHMRREIAEQPAAVAATLAQVAGPAAVLAGAVRARELDRVVLVARGTSDHVAIYARYLLEARCALSASLAAPSLYTTYRPPVDLSRALVLGVSQSGETPEIVAALDFAAGRGALTAALTNEAGSPLTNAVG